MPYVWDISSYVILTITFVVITWSFHPLKLLKKVVNSAKQLIINEGYDSTNFKTHKKWLGT